MGKTFKDRKGKGSQDNYRQKFPRVRIPMDTGTIVHDSKRDKKVRWQDEWELEAAEGEDDDFGDDYR